ncbi:MAG: hypothetical protein NTZ20_04100 [Candidatus Levybacteria bacterium]|nr:hypothetical protein [Candidatus Levybacteria bacterium]MSU26201.1 hypothetical protein [Candidatus Levybacteria bacterium]
MKKMKELLKITYIPIFFASLCCLSPVILVLLSLSTISFASSITDILYDQYKWLFRLFGFMMLMISFIFYLRREKNICSINDVIKNKNKIINYFIITLILGVIGYIFFLYIVVHYVGVWLLIWK